MTIKKVNLEKIKRLRKAKGLSFNQMAEKLGYESQNGYYYLETGRNKFSAEALAMVATIFNVPIEDLFFEDKVTKMAN
ncbi:helix-turn-helix transcriptional regulator [Bacillus sp. ISL-35]|uniref:helix-turn-helix domain-containing protein n=1 Tax=Bacillus sp. ISL-35 TaxID=2819122 RepID=UPI001BE9EEE6|nr:helix-turn-helix transcriptional regulator [Bacillus sp. ISL-35]MBT2680018.1 helix-turn-helix transcriptional regulator [Bacillus sp. ISL-35]MBT2703006.1 helix-turn-helix transcriptional regulator [Chryseobacterium sp. ISL-80]